MGKKPVAFLLLACALLALVALISWPRPASAQCGSSASSCKNCHEVQKQDPVNANGAWHTAHAFGDFCEFCHAGNVKAADQAGAHTGLVDPLADVKGSCQSCHPNDYMDRAKQYADALGKPLGSTSAPAPAAATPPAASSPITNTATNCGPAAPTGGQTIDLNQAYAGLDLPPPNTLGNLSLGVMIVAVLLVLGGLVWHYDRPNERLVLLARRWLATPVLAAATPAGGTLHLPRDLVALPELESLLPLLAENDPATLRAVTQLLQDRERGPAILKALSRTDWKALSALDEREQRVLTALLGLAREMKSPDESGRPGQRLEHPAGGA